MSDRANDIFAKASLYDGKYCLPRRYWRPLPDEAPRKVDLDYAAAEELVDGGYARWVPGWSNLAPAIFLTGKPLPTPPDKP